MSSSARQRPDPAPALRKVAGRVRASVLPDGSDETESGQAHPGRRVLVVA
jgi:hypothetical protein